MFISGFKNKELCLPKNNLKFFKNSLIIYLILCLIIPSLQFSVSAEYNIPIKVYPVNEEANYNPGLTVTITNSTNDHLIILFRTNSTGSWQTLGTYGGGDGIYKQNTNKMDEKDKIYYWSINISDGNSWTNETYSFTAKPFVKKWEYNMAIISPGTKINPLAVDVNNDGIYEIFASGMDKVVCINGSNGNLIWEFYHDMISQHSPIEIGDLNKDGMPEIVISAGPRTIALHANNGYVYWNVEARSSVKHLVIGDIDGNGYPYVYICSDDVDNGINGSGRLRKLRGTDGSILAEVFAWRPCMGGLSLADANNDGDFELYMCDRSVLYHPPSFGKGMQCYDADTLELLWYEDGITCSSHCLSIIDVNNDNVLDAIAMQQSGGGIYIVDGSTGLLMPGKWADDLGLVGHSQITVFDIDYDGNLEVITNSDSPIQVWDIGNWQLDATFDIAVDPPQVADVIGDEKLEILGLCNDVNIYDSNYDLIETIDIQGRRTCVQDIDNDSQNELIIIQESGIIIVYDTSAYAPYPRVRTNNLYYSERRLNAGVYVPPPGPPQPILKDEYPKNDSISLETNPVLSINVIDFQYDHMDITISTYTSQGWKDVKTFKDVVNGYYTYTTSNMNIPDRTYYWKVIVTDLNNSLTSSEIYHFTVRPDVPVVSNPNPIDGQINILLNQENISIDLFDYQNDLLDYSIETSPNIGKAYAYNFYNGKYSAEITDLKYDTTYFWFVNVTDGSYWTRERYSFRTILPDIFYPMDLGWQFRKQITIDHTMFDSDLLNFPLLLDIIDTDLISKTRQDGFDILFMENDGNAKKLSHEIELFDQNNGHLIVWIKIPLVSSEYDTIFYMYYGNENSVNHENSADIWNNYKMVQHLNENSMIQKDSTNNNNDGLAKGQVTLNADGKIASAVDFDGQDDYIEFPPYNMTSDEDEITLSFWINPDEWITSDTIWDEYSGNYWQFTITCGKWYTRDLSTTQTGGRNNDLVMPSIVNNQWHHITLIYSVDTHIKAIYLDGQLVNKTDYSVDNLTFERTSASLGFASDGSYYDGTIDEFRIYKGILTNACIVAEYQNQNNPNSYYTIGTEESFVVYESYDISLNKGWNGISIPFNRSLQKSSIKIIYNTTTFDWNEAVDEGIILDFVYHWNEFQQMDELTTILKPGVGYSIYAFQDCIMSVSCPMNLDDSSKIVDIEIGWNQIGIPFNESLSEDNLLINYRGNTYSWPEATTNNNPTSIPIILNSIYYFNVQNQSYDVSETLKPGTAYFIYGYKEVMINKSVN